MPLLAAAAVVALASVAWAEAALGPRDPRPVPLVIAAIAILVGTAALAWTALRRIAAYRNANRRYRHLLNALAIGILELDLRPAMAALVRLRNAGVTDLRAYLADHPDFVRSAHRLVRISDANPQAMRILGLTASERDEARSIACFAPAAGALVEFLTALEARRPLFQTETRVTGRNGEPVDVLVAITIPPSGALDRVPASMLDMTERNRLGATVEAMRAQLERAQRTIVAGHLSAAIAHEINQPLGAVRTYADAGLRWLDRPEPDVDQARLAMTSVTTAVDHVHTVIGRIRTLVGGRAADLVPLDLDCVLREMAPLLQREAARHGGRVDYALDTGGRQVLGDSVLIQQVVVNLVTNAFQAMESAEPDVRVVTVSSHALGDRCELAVADRGRGLSEAAMAQRTEPFQTTKPEGMGLGLSICRSAVAGHGGTLILRNRPGGGAVVTVSIPAIANAGPSEPTAVPLRQRLSAPSVPDRAPCERRASSSGWSDGV